MMTKRIDLAEDAARNLGCTAAFVKAARERNRTKSSFFTSYERICEEGGLPDGLWGKEDEGYQNILDEDFIQCVEKDLKDKAVIVKYLIRYPDYSKKKIADIIFENTGILFSPQRIYYNIKCMKKILEDQGLLDSSLIRR